MAGARSIPVVPGLEFEYEMLRELGRGGMAIVYLARERATGREVAIKLVRAQYAEDGEALARFAREAAVVEQLHHPRIVPIHAVRRLDDGSVALIMERIPGTTLKERIGRDGPFSPERAERVLRDIADALGYAHAQGIVHRDVKPENIFIEDETGHAFLSDFGIARPIQGDDSLTLTGVAIGTPTYMSPEQIDGPILDGRSDLYSLGLVGWEMLAGRRPWDGESLYSIIYHQKHDPLPPLDAYRSDIPERLLSAIEGLLEKSPASRWASADAFITQLSAEQPAPRRAPPQPWASAPPPTTETIQYRRPMPRDEIEVLLTPQPKPRRRGLYVALAIGIPVSLAVGAVLLSGRNLRDDISGFSMVTDAPRGIAVRPSPASPANGVGVNGATTSAATGGEIATLDSNQQIATDARGSDSSAGGDSSARAAVSGAHTPSAQPRAGTASDRAQPLRIDSAPNTPARRSTSLRDAQPDARMSDGSAAAAKDAGGVGTSSTDAASAEPAPTTSARGTIVAGGVDTCLLTSSGQAYCWGGNDQGQLGNGNANRAPSPVSVAGGLRFASIAPGLSHTCAVATDGVSYCWGANDHGQLGNGSRSASASPVRVAGHHRFTTLEAGVSHSCALTSGGEIYCWGAGGAGQLGNGDVSDSSTPVPVASTVRFTQLAVGWNHSCALDDTGTAYCWGQNSSGQLGDGTAINRSTPTAVSTDLHFVAITAGGSQSCGLTDDGEAYCWGSNRFGQLGNGGTSDHATPTRVSSTTRFRAITAGGVHTCAITASGDAECWGRNSDGQLGDGTTTDHATPVRVAGGHTFTAISATGAHTCGTTRDGASYCWGYNVEGQIGDGTRTHRTTPVSVSMPTG
ncbi:MAG TPA: protein kinase [Gemmatimonadaceae bacterium]|nr:protein kinase [Gemmatimonadaceae bacterium]